MTDIDEIQELIDKDEYKTLVQALQSKKNIQRKAVLLNDEVETCMSAHLQKFIMDFRNENFRFPNFSEMINELAVLKESLSLSRKGNSLKILEKIMSREIIKKDKTDSKKEENE